MPGTQKRNTPERSKLQPKAKVHDARVDGGRPLKASEILMNPDAEARPALKPVTAEELMAFSPEEFQVRMWPLTLSECMTGSPDKWQKVIDRELRTPSCDRLMARFAARLVLAYRETKDRDTLDRVREEAWNEMQTAQATAYAMRERDTHEQTQDAALKGVEVRQTDSNKWMDSARRVFARARDGDETFMAIAERIQDELIERGWASFSEKAAREMAARLDDDREVPRSLWKDLSKAERRDPEMGYVPDSDSIVRFLRRLAKNQPQ